MIAETSLPMLEYVDDTTVNVVAKPYNIDGTHAITLSDGKRRTFSGDLSIDITVTGNGGVAVLPVTAGFWYQVYLVPSSLNDDNLSVVADVSTIGSGLSTGQPGRYIGSFKLSASGIVTKFVYRGSRFYFLRLIDWPPINGKNAQGGTTAGFTFTVDNTWKGLTYDSMNLFPAGVASSVKITANADNMGAFFAVYVQSGVSAQPLTVAPPSARFLTGHAASFQGESPGDMDVPIIDGDTHLWFYSSTTGFSNTSVGAIGFTNKYIEE